MAFCPFCGKEVAENETCSCHANEKPEAGATPKGNAPTGEGFNYNMDTSPFGMTHEAAKKKNILVIAIAAVVVAVVLIVLIVTSSMNAYKKPFKRFEKGFNSSNFGLMIEACFPKDYLDELEDQFGSYYDDWKELITELNEELEEQKIELEDDYGKNVSLSIDILNKKKAEKSEIAMLESYYLWTDQKIQKAYKVKIKYTLKGRKDSDSQRGWVYAVKFNKSGWLFYPEGDDVDLSDLIDLF